jgi:hypothetical protein
MTAITSTIEGSNSLADLAARINETHVSTVQALKTVTYRAIEVGELLLEAKAQVPHGQWLIWLGANTELSDRVAQNYMRVAKHKDWLENTKGTSYLDLGVDAALELLGHRTQSKEDRQQVQANREADRDARWQRIESTVPAGTIKPETLRLCTGVYLQQVDDERANAFYGTDKYRRSIHLTADDAANVKSLERERAELVERASALETEANILRCEAEQIEKQIRRIVRGAFVEATP